MKKGIRVRHTTEVRLFLIFFSIALLPNILFSQASEALQAFQPTKWGTELKSEAREDAPNLRKLQPTDQLRVLRSQGTWYEVDVITENGLEFRGWIQGDLAPERQAKEKNISITVESKPEESSPLASKKFRWFWDTDWEKRGHAFFSPGLQMIQQDLSGVAPAGSRVAIPGYSFAGVHLGLGGQFGIMETSIRKIPLRWNLEAIYALGLFQVRFANNFDPIEVAGDAYQIQTHRIQASSWLESRFNFKKDWSFEPGISLGYLFFESAPELKRTSRGDIVFTQIGVSTATIGIRNRFGLNEQFYLTPRWNFFLLPQYLENPDTFSGNTSNLTSIKGSGLPIFIELKAEYRWAASWAAILDFSYFQFSASHEGPSRRIDVVYTDVEIDFQEIHAALGIQYLF